MGSSITRTGPGYAGYALGTGAGQNLVTGNGTRTRCAIPEDPRLRLVCLHTSVVLVRGASSSRWRIPRVRRTRERGGPGDSLSVVETAFQCPACAKGEGVVTACPACAQREREVVTASSMASSRRHVLRVQREWEWEVVTTSSRRHFLRVQRERVTVVVTASMSSRPRVPRVHAERGCGGGDALRACPARAQRERERDVI